MDSFRSQTTTRRTGRRFRRRATILALSVAGAIGLIGPASAHAIGFSSFTATPATNQAGANTDFNIAMTFSNPADDVKDLTIGLPPGLVGNPRATPLCSVADVNADTCPPESDVGNVVTNADVIGLGLGIDIPGDLYNMTPQPGEPARFGIILRPAGGLLSDVIIQSGAELRQSDFGLNTVIKDIPNEAPPIIPGLPLPLNILSMTVSLSGTAGNPPQGFIRNPTSCVPAAATVTATSYVDPVTEVNATAPSFTPTGCDTLPFSPTFSARAGGPGATDLGQKTTVSTTISQDDGEAGLKDAFVQLPEQLGPDIARLGQSCSPADFAARTCDPISILGPARATSPLLTGPLAGNVHLVDNPGDLPKIGVDLNGELSMQVYGALSLANTVTFFGLPDIPISTFTLGFDGGPNGLVLVNARGLCTQPPPMFGTNFLGHNGATVSATTVTEIEGCGPAKANKCKKAKRKKGKRGKNKGASAAAKKGKKKKKKKCKRKKRKRKGKGR
jgi:hypothetical protein